MKRRWFFASALLAALPSLARANSYVGASAMSTSAKISDAATDFDSEDLAWKAYAGHTFWKFLGLETTYRDLGNQHDQNGGNSVHADLKAFDFGVRGVLPIGNLRLFVKAGYGYISSKGSFDVGGVVSAFDVADWQKMYGAGVEWIFGGHFGVRAEWETYDVDRDLSSLSAGIAWEF